MSLEDEIVKNTAAMQENNSLLKQLLEKSGTPAAAASKTTTTKAADKPADTKADDTKASDAEGPTYESVKAAASKWLGEHEKGSPESLARSAYLKETLWPKLKIKALGDLEGNAAELKKVQTWLDTKAKSDLLGFGVGIFAEPAKADDDSL